MTPRLDIVIPVYNEGNIILATLAELRRQVATPSRILICYDWPDDDTLSTIKAHPERVEGLDDRIRSQPVARRARRGDERFCRKPGAVRAGVSRR